MAKQAKKKKKQAKNKKVFFLLGGAVLLIAAVVVLVILLPKSKQEETSNAGETTAPGATITWKKSTKTEASSAESETTKSTAETTAKKAIPDVSTCRNIGIGGGGCFYAVGYKAGDEKTKALVAAGIRQLEDQHTLKELADVWFINAVYPRDEKRQVFGSSNNDLIRKFKEDGLKIGVIDGNAPVASFENGQAVGFEIDVAKACFALYHIEPEFVAVTVENAAEKLNNGEVDLVWGGLRDGAVKGIDYSDVNEWNLENEMCYYTTSGSRYKGETALLDEVEKMGVVKGSLCANFIKDRLKTAGYDVQIVEYTTAREAFAALGSDDVDCVACDYLTAYAMWKKG